MKAIADRLAEVLDRVRENLARPKKVDSRAAADELADACSAASVGLTEAASSLQRRGARQDSEDAFWRRDSLDTALATYRAVVKREREA